MTVILAIGVGVLMTALAVAIGGLAIEFTLLKLSHSFTANSAAASKQIDAQTVINLKVSDNNVSALEWAEEAAA